MATAINARLFTGRWHDVKARIVRLAPLVLELQEECREMSVDEFEKFRDDVIQEVKKQNLNQSFMRAAFDVIYGNLFEKHVA